MQVLSFDWMDPALNIHVFIRKMQVLSGIWTENAEIKKKKRFIADNDNESEDKEESVLKRVESKAVDADLLHGEEIDKAVIDRRKSHIESMHHDKCTSFHPEDASFEFWLDGSRSKYTCFHLENASFKWNLNWECRDQEEKKKRFIADDDDESEDEEESVLNSLRPVGAYMRPLIFRPT